VPIRIDIVRHATAEPRGPHGDATRALDSNGRAAADVLGAELGAIGWRPQCVWASPYVRAQQTARRVLAAARVDVRVAAARELEPENDPAGVTAWLAAVADGAAHIALFSHQPLVGRLVGDWTGTLLAGVATGELFGVEFERAPGSRAGRIVTHYSAH